MEPELLLKYAKSLRAGMTEVEKILWYHLRNKRFGVKFRRQVPLGSYIVDFVCMEKRLIIEVDGGQHQSNYDYDFKRTAYFNKIGFILIRFWNNEVLQELQTVLACIHNQLK